MPVLRNTKHEAFAQALAKGSNISDAYVLAGYRKSRSAASRLSTNVNIERRVREIQNKVSEKAEWSAADRLASLKKIHDAQVKDDPRIAIQAIAEANKMQGSHAAQKHQHSGAIGTYDLAKLSDDELDRLEAILGPLADAGGDQGGEA